MHRLKIISGHLGASGPSGSRRDFRRAECGSAAGRSPEDVVVVHGLRTAIGKAKRGALKVTCSTWTPASAAEGSWWRKLHHLQPYRDVAAVELHLLMYLALTVYFELLDYFHFMLLNTQLYLRGNHCTFYSTAFIRQIDLLVTFQIIFFCKKQFRK